MSEIKVNTRFDGLDILEKKIEIVRSHYERIAELRPLVLDEMSETMSVDGFKEIGSRAGRSGVFSTPKVSEDNED